MRCMYFLPGLVLLLSFPSFAVAQSAEAVPATTIHARSNLVVVDVTVLDAQQIPVHSLTANDFKVFEDGHLQTVKDFEEHSSGTEQSPVTPLRKLEPGTYTNFTPVPASGPLNILLIDFLNTPMVDRPYLRKHVLKFLRQMQPGTQVAIFVMSDRLYFLQGFTADVDRLCAAVGSEGSATPALQPVADKTTAEEGKPQAGTADAAIQKEPPQAINEQSEGPSLTQIEVEAARVLPLPPLQRQANLAQEADELAHYLAALPGRKNLIWFADSFPGPKFISGMMMSPSFGDQSEDTNKLLSASRVAVYPVDAAGLRSDQATTNGDSATGSNFAFFIQQGNLFSSMRDLAEKTGGRPFFNTNDLARATEQAVEAGSNYYTLTYVPSKAPVGIAPYRSIKVDVARKDVTLFYRNKYPVDNPHAQNRASNQPSPTAPKNAPPDAAPALSDAMRVAMIHGAPEPTGIIFQVTPRPTAADPEPAAGNKASNSGKGRYRNFNLHIAASVNNIDCPADKDGARHCALQFVSYVYDSTGTLFGNLIIPVKFAIPPDHYDAVLRDGIDFNEQIGVPQNMQDCTLRIGILDVTSGRVGAVEFPLAEAAKLAPDSATHP